MIPYRLFMCYIFSFIAFLSLSLYICSLSDVPQSRFAVRILDLLRGASFDLFSLLHACVSRVVIILYSLFMFYIFSFIAFPVVSFHLCSLSNVSQSHFGVRILGVLKRCQFWSFFPF